MSLYNVLHIYMENSTTGENDKHKYVSMSRAPRKQSHAYWPIASDFGNFLGHTSVAIFFLSHEELIRLALLRCGVLVNMCYIDYFYCYGL